MRWCFVALHTWLNQFTVLLSNINKLLTDPYAYDAASENTRMCHAIELNWNITFIVQRHTRFNFVPVLYMYNKNFIMPGEIAVMQRVTQYVTLPTAIVGQPNYAGRWLCK
jgi:hypothetical protein